MDSDKIPAMEKYDSWDSYRYVAKTRKHLIKNPDLPLVSIVTPSFNQGKFIKETIESVLTQDYPNIEYWIIDGGSTDSTLDVLQAYSNHPLVSIVSERDRGHADAVNKGWARSEGEIFGWLNSDDVYLSGAVSKLVGYLLGNPQVGVVYGDAVFTDACSNRIGKYWARRFTQYEQLRYSCIPQPTAFIRRNVVQQTGPLSLALKMGFDYEYWLRVSHSARLDYLPGEFATYRMHADSKTVGSTRKFNPDMERIVASFLSDPRAPAEIVAQHKKIWADNYAAMGMNSAKSNDLPDAVRYLRKSLTSMIRPRALLLLLHIASEKLGSSFAMRLNEQWTKVRSRN
jgi:glycosyltransferase involved in cell wall biosynthesis